MKNTFKQLYKIIPLKLFVFKVVRKIFSLKESFWIHLFFKGDFKFQNGGESYKMRNYNCKLETSLFWTGDFQTEKESLNVWKQLSKSSSFIFDIGANTGVFSILAKGNNSQSNVYAFEPIERIYDRLNYNFNLNKMNISSYKKAISNTDGIADIYDLDVDHHYHASLKKTEVEHFTGIKPIQVEALKLDSFLRDEKLPSVDLVKIDVEGFEVEVIEGMQQIIEDYAPTILIEIKSEKNALLIENMTQKFNYMYYDIDEQNGLIKTESLRKSSCWNCLLLGPKHHAIII